MDKFKDKIIGYKTYYFNMIFSQNTKSYYKIIFKYNFT